MNIEILILAIISALIPVVFRFYIIRRKKQAKMMGRFLFTFLLSGLGAVAIFNYEKSIQIYLSNVGFSLFLVFIIYGILIEYFKNITVRIGGFKYFKNVDDVMDLSFASALGFTFFENIFHFYLVFSGHNPEIIGPVKMIKYFLMREFFILPVHLFCSGMFGYFYAMGIFSSKELIQKSRKDFSYQTLRIFCRLIFIPESWIHKIVRIMQGTLISVFFYALFFTILTYDPKISDVMNLLGANWFFHTTESGQIEPRIDEHLIPVIAFGFFQVGSIILFSYMDIKKRYESKGLLISK